MAGLFRLNWNPVLDSQVSLDKEDVIVLVGSLVERSLLAYDEETGRYSMLETVRQYSREQLLGDGSAARIRGKHLEAMVDYIERTVKRTDSDGFLAAPALTVELDNIRAACQQAISLGRYDLIAKMLGGFPTYWFIQGNFEEPISLLRQALEPHLDGDLDRTLADALLLLCYFEGAQGLYGEEEAHLQLAMRAWNEFGDADKIAECHRLMGNVLLERSETAEAKKHYEAAFEKVAGHDPEGKLRSRLGGIALLEGQVDMAGDLLEQAFAAGTRENKITPGLNLALVAIIQGRLPLAREVLTFLSSVFASTKSPYGLFHFSQLLACYSLAVGRTEATPQFIGLLDRLSDELVLTPASFEDGLLEKASSEATLILGEERFESLVQEGHTLSFAAAIDLANSVLAEL